VRVLNKNCVDGIKHKSIRDMPRAMCDGKTIKAVAWTGFVRLKTGIWAVLSATLIFRIP
jgi:hypothetical protein